MPPAHTNPSWEEEKKKTFCFPAKGSEITQRKKGSWKRERERGKERERRRERNGGGGK